jgi:Ca-activated chloride channel homolog
VRGAAVGALVALAGAGLPAQSRPAPAPVPRLPAPAPRLPAPAPAPPAPAAAAATAPEARFEGEVSVAWILVPVTVKSAGGRWIRNLGREDFTLRVDGRKVRFTDFEPRGEVPWSLVFLQDLSGSMANGGRLDASREAVRHFLDAARFGDEFALASFAGATTAVDVPFTEDLEPLRETVSGWEAYGRTALHDAVALLPQISGNSRNLKRAVVLITDGVDNASQMTANQARDLVRRAELPVFVLGLESGDPKVVSARGEKVHRYADVLNLLAAMTGGRYFPIRGVSELKEACATIAEELRYQYVLGFETTGTGASRYRPMTVEVRRRNVRVTARQGYRGTRPAS